MLKFLVPLIAVFLCATLESCAGGAHSGAEAVEELGGAETAVGLRGWRAAGWSKRPMNRARKGSTKELRWWGRRRNPVVCRNVTFEVGGIFRHLPSPKCFDPDFYLCRRHEDTRCVTNITNCYSCEPFDRTHLPSNVNVHKETIFIVHGFDADSSEDWVGNMTKALLEKDDFNVIKVDWGQGSGKYVPWYQYYKCPYSRAASNTRVVGATIADIMEKMMDERSIQNTKLWCVGHSLGAHVCGHAGRRMAEKDRMIARITGLDPANPLFDENRDYRTRLGPDCASFVDVIHTDGAGLLHLGTHQALGHVDFYVETKVCLWNSIIDIGLDILAEVENGLSWVCRHQNVNSKTTCRHSSSHDLFVESVTNEECFISTQQCQHENDVSPVNVQTSCPSNPEEVQVVMGYGAQPEFQGIYYIKPSSKEDHCTKP